MPSAPPPPTPPPPGARTPALARFDLELERVRLRALLAVEVSGGRPRPAVMERLGGELEEAEGELWALRAAGGRAEELAHRLGLGGDELDLMWSAVAAAADPRLWGPLAVLGGPEGRLGVPLSVHALLLGLDGPRGRALGRALLGGHPLLDRGLLQRTDAGPLLPTSPGLPLLAAPRLAAWLAGDDRLDQALQGAAEVVVPPASRQLDPAQERVEERLRLLLGAPERPLIVVEGPRGTGRRTAVAAAAQALGREVVALDLVRLPAGAAALEAALVGLGRECLLRQAIPLVAGADEAGGGPTEAAGALRGLSRALDGWPGPVAVTAVQPGVELPVRRPVVRLGYPVPETRVRRALWQAAVAAADVAAAVDLELLAIRYRLGAGAVARAVASGQLLAGADRLATHHLVAGVRTNIAERLGELAQRIEVRQSWDDLVLAPDLLDQARALVARVRHAHRVLEDWGFADKLPRGQGVAALFSGPPGTGKTMLAGLLARELDLELYQVDLSKVVSKWVGETEKQLARIFEAADAGHALLLFDEADALFGKRTEVRSAVDRYANLEVNYLLQRIESFGGMTVLTTNMDASIDPALRRRLACHIAFWPPDLAERRLLWRRMLSGRGPVAADVDLEQLAQRYADMTGANIRNAVLSAAFLAAAEGGEIGQALLERAARGEYAAMGRVLRGGKP